MPKPLHKTAIKPFNFAYLQEFYWFIKQFRNKMKS